MLIALALAAGAIVPLQTGTNAALSRGLGNGIMASFVVFVIAALCMGIVLLIMRQSMPAASQLTSIPAYAWVTGGILGTVYIFLLIYLAPKLGMASVTGFVVAGQLLMAVIFDHFGLMNFPVHAINWQRMAGILLMAGGLFLIKKF